MSRFSNRVKGAVAGVFAAAQSTGARAPLDHPSPQPPVSPSPEAADNTAVYNQLSYLTDVAELQRLELARLLDQNRRLNRRVDQLLIMQQRDHALRERLHAVLARFTDADIDALAREADTRIAKAEARYSALRQSVGHLVGYLAQSGTAVDKPINCHTEFGDQSSSVGITPPRTN